MTTAVDDMPDAMGVNAQRLSSNLRKVAGYVTGTGGVEWTREDWDHFPHASKVRLSQSNGEAVLVCDGFDIEDHAWELSAALDGAKLRREHHLRTDFYFPEGMLSDVEDNVGRVGLDGWVDYWVANPSLSREQAIARLGTGTHGRIKSWQWAFPSTNPHTKVPGMDLTLAQVNADLSVTLQDWHPIPTAQHTATKKIVAVLKKAKPTKKVTAGTAGSGGGIAIVSILNAYGVHLTPAEAAAVPSLLAFISAWLKKEGY